MVVTVARHEVDAAKAQEQVEYYVGNRERRLVRIERSPKALYFLQENATMEASGRTVLDPSATSAVTWEAVGLAMQASSAMFIAASKDEGQAAFRILDQDFTIPATGPTQDTTAGTWLRAMSLAMICRERQRVDVLAQTPIDALRARSGVADEFQFEWIRALQIYWRSENGLIDSLLRAMQGADPEADTVAGPAMTAQVLYPPIELFYLLTQREDAKFNESLARALELHRQYWTANSERQNDPEGFVAWRVLAIACLAKDAGVDITVESDYLPQHLLDATWVGEKQL